MPSALARHILVKDAAHAEQLKAQLAQGADFAQLARRHSLCPSAKRGGDLGEVYPGQMVPVIDKVIFKQAVKVIHGPVKSRFGFHLVQVLFRG